MERLGLSGYDEAQGLDASAGELVSTGNLMFLRVESSAREKGHTTLYNECCQSYVHYNMLIMILKGVLHEKKRYTYEGQKSCTHSKSRVDRLQIRSIGCYRH